MQKAPALRRALALALLFSLFSLVLGARAAAQGGTDQDDIVVQNDVFEITFSVKGGVPVRWTVVDPKAGPSDPERLDLIDREYLAASAFRPLSVVVAKPAGDTLAASDTRAYEVERSEADGATILTFTSPVDARGLQIVKTFRLAPGFVLGLEVQLRNTSDAPLPLAAPGLTLGPGLGYAAGRQEHFDEGRSPAVLAFYKTDGGVYDAYATPAGEAGGVAPGGEAAEATPLDWGGVASQYFMMAAVPGGTNPPAFVDMSVLLESTDAIDKLVAAQDREWYPCITFYHAEQTVPAGGSATVTYSIYAGPQDRSLLLENGLGLQSVLFHHLWGWLAGVCLALQSILAVFEGFLGNWGLAILLFALLFRAITLPLSLFSAKSAMLMQAKMTELKPLVAELKVRHKGNSEKLNNAILALYKQHGINPFSHFKGCLPLVIQLPVLIALFQLLLNSYDLRGASFLWIGDLTLTDRLAPLPFSVPWLGSYVNLLPLIMLTAMIIVGRSMQVPGKEQPSIGHRLIMPIAMTLLFYPFPAGCMLFWATGNVIQIFEQRRTTARVAQALA